jgi:seryl-tRNA synthetase
MIDIKLIRDNPEVVYQAMEKRGEGRAEVDEMSASRSAL